MHTVAAMRSSTVPHVAVFVTGQALLDTTHGNVRQRLSALLLQQNVTY